MYQEHFRESIETKERSLSLLGEQIEADAQRLIELYEADGKMLICGNGGSAADAQHLAAELINRFEKERRPLAAIALTTDSSNLTSIANDYSYDEIFSKQVEALGRKGDCLVVISTSGNSENILRATKAALDRGMSVIALTGESGGRLAEITHEALHLVKVPSGRTARVQEVHLLIIHIWCAYLDAHFA